MNFNISVRITQHFLR
ncbi:hypothetical protein GBAR_LOCUS6279 [Geodia barretti]|uniref:Uncharacterized protein n=1 Tax=Geodia barretti TaxID=519541 RepID=A0AA35RD74_GEOBA|nr:hypothetical protein GBAR_LOCUS6279 [Geodia barretti]